MEIKEIKKENSFKENVNFINIRGKLDISKNPMDFILNPTQYYKDKNNQYKIKFNGNKKNYFLIIYKFHEVIIIKLDFNETAKKIGNHLKPRFLREFRLFSEDSELYLWRDYKTYDRNNEGYKDQFSWRYIKDQGITEGNISKTTNIFEEHHIMWGTNVESDGVHKISLKEPERKINIQIYHPDINLIKKSELPVMYCIRNYFKFNNGDESEDIGLIKFFDARLVHLCKTNPENGERVILK